MAESAGYQGDRRFRARGNRLVQVGELGLGDVEAAGRDGRARAYVASRRAAR